MAGVKSVSLVVLASRTSQSTPPILADKGLSCKISRLAGKPIPWISSIEPPFGLISLLGIFSISSEKGIVVTPGPYRAYPKPSKWILGLNPPASGVGHSARSEF